jgi:hypothetical protein
MITSPVTLANIELEKYGSNDPESTVNVLATLPSYVPAADKPLPAVNALALDATTPVKPDPFPLNDPLNDPEWTNPEAPVVATILPVPLIAVVVKLPAVPPPITTFPDVKPSTCMFARLAVLPDTITFFQVAMFVVLFYYKYMFF